MCTFVKHMLGLWEVLGDVFDNSTGECDTLAERIQPLLSVKQ